MKKAIKHALCAFLFIISSNSALCTAITRHMLNTVPLDAHDPALQHTIGLDAPALQHIITHLNSVEERNVTS